MIQNLFKQNLKEIVYVVGVTVSVLLFIIVPMYEMRQDIALQAKDISYIQVAINEIKEQLKERISLK